MRISFDPSLLVALYLPEERTFHLRQGLASSRSTIGLNTWQELEFRNAARQKVLRRKADEGDLARTFRVFEDDCVHGRIIRRHLSWDATFATAEKLSKKFATSRICRAFGLIHVAIATATDLKDFATLDSDQAELAGVAGLAVVNLPI